MASKALEVNIASTRVDVTISGKYKILPEVLSRYPGIMEGLNAFLEELCHPYRNWGFILKEARGYALDYFYVLTTHPKGPEAAAVFMEVFLDAFENAQERDLKSDAVDNLMLYLRKVIKESGDVLDLFLPVLARCFRRVSDYEDEDFFYFVAGYYQINGLAKLLLERVSQERDLASLHRLVHRYLNATFLHWLSVEDPLTWFKRKVQLKRGENEALQSLFEPLSHHRMRGYLKALEEMAGEVGGDNRRLLERLATLPGYGTIADGYRRMPVELKRIAVDQDSGDLWKLLFLFHIMNIAGLFLFHEETLRDINRTMAKLIGRLSPPEVRQLIEKTFEILGANVKAYPGTALNTILNMGRAVYKTDESDLVDFFMDQTVSLGFQSPDVQGIGGDWQIRANSVHIQNIRTWMELIEINPKWSKKLLSSLVIHLSLCGVLIRDTDLFPRDITNFLNSDIRPVYNLAKQLARLLPAYFNDIGAEGQLRDISTRIDEVSQRKDVLVHFLRKQSHVESSNRIIGLMEALLDFWRTKKKAVLRPYLPPELYRQLEEQGPYIDGVHTLVNCLFRGQGLPETQGLLRMDDATLEQSLGGVKDAKDTDRERVQLAVALYRLLDQKYHLGFTAVDHYLAQVQAGGFFDLDRLRAVLSEEDQIAKLDGLLAYLEDIQTVILSEERYEIREDIYRKRHFAVDIPSMYGSYHEAKFDALGLSFRLESLVNVLFEEIVDGFNLQLITRATFFRINEILRLFHRALRLDGISPTEMERQLDLLARSLAVRGFSFTQFLDIFRGFSQAVKNIVNDYFNNIHQSNLHRILEDLPRDRLLSKYLPKEKATDRESLNHRTTEIFLRDRIATSLGLQQLDLFLSRILNTLHQQSDKLPPKGLRRLLNYDPHKATTFLAPVGEGVSDIIYLGNKGLNLARLTAYGFPVPPGFIITTEVFRCREVIDNYKPATDNLKEEVRRKVKLIEQVTGRVFGDATNPLLFSVRSGAPISQPGMMGTLLDVGMNEEIVRGIAALSGNDWFAWDCYRRFLQSYGMAFGLNRDDFDEIILMFKERLGVPYKREFSGAQMKQIALQYRDSVSDQGIEIETSPYEQLYVAVRKVFDSWDADKAVTFRQIMGISNDWGTAVTVQEMVFGNLSDRSGTGVLFTHNPRWPSDTIRLWGDFTTGNQGEDVVSGLVKTLPISREQAEMENRQADITLETHFPIIYNEIRNFAKRLIYNEKWAPQEMEFTFEGPSGKALYFLQTRDMAIRERKKVLSFSRKSGVQVPLVGHGIGVSGGAMTGRVVYNTSEIRQWREKEPETSLILVRNDTVPDDIREIHAADGLLTARGGSTSHAAIVAHRLGKTCVVGCADLICAEKESRCTLNQAVFRAGDQVSIDGREGSVYEGVMAVEETERG